MNDERNLIERALEALKPFAREADRWEPMGGTYWRDECPFPANSISSLIIADLRRAREAATALERLTAQPEGDLDGRARELRDREREIIRDLRGGHGTTEQDAANLIEKLHRELCSALSQAQGGEEGLREALKQCRTAIVMGLAFIGRDQGTERLDKTLEGLCAEFAKADAVALEALGPLPAPPATPTKERE